MKRSFKPQVETLESRLVMDAAGTHALYQDLVVPTAPTPSEVLTVASPEASPLAGATQSNRLISFRASDPNTLLQMDAPDLAGTQAVTGRITAIVADPSDAQSTAFDPEWRYVPIRRFASVGEEPTSTGSAIVFVGGWGSSMYQYSFNDPTSGIGDGSVRFVSIAAGAVPVEGASSAAASINVLLGDASARSCNADNDDATLPMSLDGEASSMNRPNPGKMNLEHYFDTATPVAQIGADIDPSATTGATIEVYFHVIRRSTDADANGHGTHVAGTFVAVANNTFGHELGHWQGLMTGR